MDISGTPPKSGAAATPTTGKAAAWVALDQLPLEAGKQYVGTVIGKASGENVGKQAGNAPLPGQPATGNTYTLSLAGKPVLITSEQPLQSGQQLTVQLRALNPPQLAVVSETAGSPNGTPGRLNAAQVTSVLQAFSPLLAKQSTLAAVVSQLHAQTSQGAGDAALGRLALSLLNNQALRIAPTMANQTGSAAATDKQPGQTQAASPLSPVANNLIPQLRAQLQQSGLFLEQQLKLAAASARHSALHSAAGATQASSAGKGQPAPSPSGAATGRTTGEGAGSVNGANGTQATSTALLNRINSLIAALSGTPTNTQSTANAAGRSATTGASPHNTTPLAENGGKASPALVQQLERLVGSEHARKLAALLINTSANTNATQTGVTPADAALPGATTANATAAGSPLQAAMLATLSRDLKGQLVQLIAVLQATAETAASTEKTGANLQQALLQSPFNFPHPASMNTLGSAIGQAHEPLDTGQMLRLLASLLNRLQFNQLNSLYQSHTNSSEGSSQQSWFFELPLQIANEPLQTLNLRIDKREQEQQQGKNQEEGKKTLEWELALSFDLEGLGPLYIQVTLQPPRARASVWAQDTRTLALIEQERQHFQQALQNLGLEVAEVQCQRGQPKRDRTTLEHRLVDTKA